MDAELEGWLSDTVLPDFGPQVRYDEVALAWFSELYATSGALSGEALWTAAVTHQYELAKDAVFAVHADVTATVTERSLTIVPEILGFVVRVSCDGKFSDHDGGRMLSFAPGPALLEVATTVQDLITGQYWMVWPECLEHGRALLAEAREQPTWICRAGPHEIAPIGSLRAG